MDWTRAPASLDIAFAPFGFSFVAFPVLVRIWSLGLATPRPAPVPRSFASISSYSPAVAPTWPRHDAPRYDPNVITPMSSPFSQLDVRGRRRAQPDGG
ncbi:hypothetical protein B0H11DRAFT_2236862 [Mycena galericulata]|nr:hypothetical protein B0H11DRAFT_2236862 [Mycena galericulata]